MITRTRGSCFSYEFYCVPKLNNQDFFVKMIKRTVWVIEEQNKTLNDALFIWFYQEREQGFALSAITLQPIDRKIDTMFVNFV